MSGEDLIRQAAALNAQKKYDEAIELIESNIDAIDDDLKLNAWLEVFYAGKAKGDQAKATQYALLIREEEPDLPSVKNYLKKLGL